MKNYIIFILLVLLVATCSSKASEKARESLDQAIKAIREDHYAAAAQAAERSINDGPSIEAYNALGLARENLRQYDLANNAFSSALKLEPGNKGVIKNHRRIVIRTFFWNYRRHFTWILLGSIGLLCLIALKNYIVRRWRKYCFYKKYRGVQLKSSEIFVREKSGRLQDDGRAYPDTRDIRMDLILTVPLRKDIFPFSIVLDIFYPNGQKYRQLIQEVKPENVIHSEARLIFKFTDDLEEILQNAGNWKFSGTLEQTNRCIFSKNLEVVSEATLVNSLIVSRLVVLTGSGNKLHQESVVLDDSEIINLYLELTPRDYLSSKYQGMSVDIELLHTKSSLAISAMNVPLDLNRGSQEICLEHPVIGSQVSELSDQWEFHVKIGNKRLATVPFTVISREEVLKSLKLSEITLAGKGPRGSIYRIDEVTYRRPLSIVPLFSFETKFPTRSLSVPVSFGICLNNESAAEYIDEISPTNNRFDWAPCEYILPEWENGQNEIEVGFVLFVNNKMLAVKSIRICKRAPNCANSQGQLTNIRNFSVDPSEAEEILAAAEVRR